MQHATRSELLSEFRVFGIIGILRFLFRIQVIEISKEFVEAVHRRQKFIAVAEMVFAKLTGNVSKWFQNISNCRVFGLKSESRARQTYFRQSCADRRLTGNKGSPAGSAALLTVPVGKHRAFFDYPVDIGRTVTHYSVVVSADVEPTDIIAPDNQYVRFGCSVFCWHSFS